MDCGVIGCRRHFDHLEHMNGTIHMLPHVGAYHDLCSCTSFALFAQPSDRSTKCPTRCLFLSNSEIDILFGAGAPS